MPPAPPPVRPSWLLEETFEEYRARAKQNLTSHALGDFRRCPFLFRQRELGLVPDLDLDAFRLGTATHLLTVEGLPSLAKRYAMGGPINPKTEKPYGPRTQKFEEWAEQQGLPVLTDDDVTLATAMAHSVKTHPLARTAFSGGFAEGVIRVNVSGVPIQTRLDYYTPSTGNLDDFKTCRDLDEFVEDSYRYGYIYQLAFYAKSVAVAGGKINRVRFVVTEKEIPFRCGIWVIGQAELKEANEANMMLLDHMKACRAADSWPTNYEDERDYPQA